MAGNRTRFKSPIATRHLARTDTGAAVTVQLGRPRARRTGELSVHIVCAEWGGSRLAER
jgi:hypothetical protein